MSKIKIKIKTIRWKKCYGGYDGIHNNEIIFHISGNLCVTDLRPTNETHFRQPEHYKITDIQNAKDIAKDLLNERNLELHHANRDAWIAEQNRTTELIQEGQRYLDSLK